MIEEIYRDTCEKIEGNLVSMLDIDVVAIDHDLEALNVLIEMTSRDVYPLLKKSGMVTSYLIAIVTIIQNKETFKNPGKEVSMQYLQPLFEKLGITAFTFCC